MSDVCTICRKYASAIDWQSALDSHMVESENKTARIRELEAENKALREGRGAARNAVNRLGRAMGVVPGAAQCFGDVIEEAIKRLSALSPASVSVPEAEQDKLLATAKDVVNLIEGLDGYGLARSVLDETRLKDEPRWVFFYNEVAAQSRAALAETEGRGDDANQ